jgi:outer membrane protein TolC
MTALLLALLVAAPADTLDLTLDQALRTALRRSPAQTQVRVAQTESASKLARGITDLLPSVSASVGYGHSESSFLPESLRTDPDWGWTGTVSLNQVVFDPTVFAGVATSVIYSGYHAADARDKQARLIYDVTADYLNLLKSHLLRDAATAALRRAEENLRIADARQELGAASRIDAMRSAVFKSQADIDLLRADKTLAVAQETFKATVGLDDPAPVRPVERLAAPADLDLPEPDSLLEEIRRRNPGLALAAVVRTAAGINHAAAIGRALPGISAYWTSSYSDSLFPRSCSRWTEQHAITYGLRASFPLLDLKSYVLGIVDAANESRRARAAARAAELRIRATATAATLEYGEAKQTYDYSRRNLELNEQLHELATEQRRLGGISLADYFGVQADLARARATLISALCDTYIQAARINYLLGVSTIDPDRKENQ